MRAVRAGLLVAAAAAWTALAAPASGQTVRGEIVEAETGAALPAAFVTLLDAEGTRIASTLTDGSGRFNVSARAPGRYVLRVERLGHETSDTPPFELAAGQVRSERIEVPVRAIDLAGIEVEAEGGPCALPHDVGAETHGLWDEIRKALEITVWAAEHGGPPYHAHLFERARDLVTDEILPEHVHRISVRSGISGTPFHAATPDALASEGFIRPEADGSYRYLGLDAHALLSEAFLETHCFRVRAPEPPGSRLIGLGFEPVAGRTVPDVTGVLWVDRETLELRTLEYAYTTHLHVRDVPAAAFGGRTEFRRLANGAWMVDRWQLRMPELPDRPTASPASIHTAGRPLDTDRGRRARAREAGLTVREEGGTIRAVVEPVAEPASGTATISGTVRDETRDVPIAGATVFVAGHPRAGRTRPDGSFHLTGLPRGVHEVGFFHARTDELSLAPITVPVELRADETAHLELAIPAEAACPPSAPDEEPTAALTGFAVHRVSGEPVPAAALSVVWSVPLPRTLWEAVRGIQHEERGRRDIVSDTSGRFLACGIPLDASVWAGQEGGNRVELDIEAAALVRRDLLVR